MPQTKQQSTTAAIAAAIKTLSEHIVDGDALLAMISEQSIDSWPIVDGVMVVEEDIWHANDGNAEITGEFDSGLEAAQDYVSDGDWGDRSETSWVTVHVWREGIDADGDIVRVDEDSHKIMLEAEEPECVDGGGHDWQSPYEIVGGIKENPGVWGHGGGVTITECCMRCGCAKVTDTWAQDPSDGEQGLNSVSYEPGRFADAIERPRAEEEDEDEDEEEE